jgi:hypothetical protein
MTSSEEEACRQALESILTRSASPTADDLRALGALSADALEQGAWTFGRDRGAEAIPTLAAVAERGDRDVRRAARRALYRLSQRGVVAAEPAPAARPIVARVAERPLRAWVSGIDGSGARAAWILFEGAFGALRLCSLILSDTEGVLDVAGGDITKKRLDRELAQLRATQKLPWVETEPTRVVGLVAEALSIHATAGTPPPAAFARWRPLFEGAARPVAPESRLEPDSADVERSVELLELPEMSAWFLDPATVQGDALEMLGSRESRLVVSDQIKADREEALVTRVVEREMPAAARALWARRLDEMALIFEATDRGDAARLARAAAAALAAETYEVRRHPFARALARRALDVASEVALGRLKLTDVSRQAARERGESVTTGADVEGPPGGASTGAGRPEEQRRIISG